MASIRKIRMLLLYFLEINAMLGFCKSFPISFCPVPEKESQGSEVYNRFMKWIFSKDQTDTISILSQTDRLEPRRSDFVLTKEMHEKDPLNTRRSDFMSMKTMPEKGETGDLEPRPSDFKSINKVYAKSEKDPFNTRHSDFMSMKTMPEKDETGDLEPRPSDFKSINKVYAKGEKDPLNTRRSDFTSMKTMPEKGETGDLEPRPSDFKSMNKVYAKAAKADFPLPDESVFPGFPAFAPHHEVPFGLPELPVINRELQGGLPDVLNDQQRRIIRNLGGNLRDAADEWDERNSRSTEGQNRGSEIIRNMLSAFYQVLILPCFKILNLAFHVMEEFIEDWLHKE